MWIEAKTGGGGGGGQTLTPSDSSPATITNGETYTANGSGLAVQNISNITPGATPADVTSGLIYKMLGAGKVVDAITDITPGSTPADVTSGLTYRMGGAGKLVSQIIDLTPSSSPQGVTAGVTYKMGASGKVVDAIPDVTPTTSGQYFTSGAKNMTASGYAYSQQPSVSGYSEIARDTASAAKSHAISGLSGKTVLVLIFQYSSGTSMAYNRFDNATASGGTMTKVGNLLTANAIVVGTFFTIKVTSNSLTISTGSNNSRCLVLGATL